MSLDEANDLAAVLDVSTDDVFEMEKRMHGHDYAFDGLVDADDDESFSPASYLSSEIPTPAEAVAQEEWDNHAHGQLADALADLDERSRDIVVRRWVDEPKARLEELGEHYGVSAERIRQIEVAAFKKLRKVLGPELSDALG